MARPSIRKVILGFLIWILSALRSSRRGTRALYKDAGVQTELQPDEQPEQTAPTVPALPPPSTDLSLVRSDSKIEYSSPITAQPLSRLLSLPAELRNKIYLEVLEERSHPFYINVTPANPGLPAFLRTCRQIRLEAISIYLKENEFNFDIIDLRPVKPSTSSCHWTVKSYNGVSLNDCKVLYGTFSGRADWDNLKEWLRLFYEGEMSGLCATSALGWRGDVGSVFDSVASFLDCEKPVPWEKVESSLGPSQRLIQSNVKDQVGLWR